MKSLNVFAAKKIRFKFWLKIFCIHNVKSCQSAFKPAPFYENKVRTCTLL